MDRQKTLFLPIFPGYVFVRFSGEQIAAIPGTEIHNNRRMVEGPYRVPRRLLQTEFAAKLKTECSHLPRLSEGCSSLRISFRSANGHQLTEAETSVNPNPEERFRQKSASEDP
jgi:hypothetical protein